MRALPLVVTAVLAACASSQAQPSAPAAADPEPAPAPSDPSDDTGSAQADDAKEPVPRFERTNIGDTGLSAYLPKGFPVFDVTDSEEGSHVHTGELELGRFTFTCIALRFKEPMSPDDDREAMLIGYLDFLQKQFGITGTVGYGRGHTLESEPLARGVIDFWTDAEGTEYSIEGWVTPTHLAVMMVSGHGEYPYDNARRMFLEGIRFSPAP